MTNLPAPPKKRLKGRTAILVLGAIGIVAVVTALGLSLDDSDDTTPSAPAQSSSVDWENYSPSVKARIDSLAAAGDCSGLQREFDIADENDDAQRARVGSGNADLMSYIDDKMRATGCY